MQKKYVFVMNAIELLQKLVSGKRVEGVLYIDQDTGRLTFKAWNRKSPKHRVKDRLIRLLEHGWVKESAERIKVYESIPKVLGTARVMDVLDRESEEIKDALIDRELIEFL